MAIKYEFYPTPRPEGVTKKGYHARVVASGKADTDRIAEEIQKECSLTRTDVKAVLLTSSMRTPKII